MYGRKPCLPINAIVPLYHQQTASTETADQVCDINLAYEKILQHKEALYPAHDQTPTRKSAFHKGECMHYF